MEKLPHATALLIVDVQQGFYELDFWGPRNNPQAEANIARLIEAWRVSKRPIMHIRHKSLSPTSPLRGDGPGFAFKPEACPLEGEPVYTKSVNSSFIGTTLENDLRTAHLETLVIVGLTTNHCVSTTTRMAGNLGFRTYIVEDATATFDRKGLDGRMRPAAEVHASALSDIHEEFATVVSTEAVLRAVR